MNIKLLRSIFDLLPSFARPAAGKAYDYAGRVGRWVSILWWIRGKSLQDEAKLVGSALAAIVISLRDLDRWQDPRLFWDCEVYVRNAGIFALRRFSDDLHHVWPKREPIVYSAIKSILGPGDMFIDAGANIGFYSVVAARAVGSGGEVLAIEMMPDTGAILNQHVGINGLKNIRIVNAALSDEAGQRVDAFVETGKFGQASISTGPAKFSKSVSVETETLDHLLERKGKVALMKMDLEGAERLALVGGESVLGKISAIIFEDRGEGDAARLLKDCGYEVSRLDGKDYLARRVASSCR